jgi:hypothetical protein
LLGNPGIRRGDGERFFADKLRRITLGGGWRRQGSLHPHPIVKCSELRGIGAEHFQCEPGVYAAVFVSLLRGDHIYIAYIAQRHRQSDHRQLIVMTLHQQLQQGVHFSTVGTAIVVERHDRAAGIWRPEQRKLGNRQFEFSIIFKDPAFRLGRRRLWRTIRRNVHDLHVMRGLPKLDGDKDDKQTRRQRRVAKEGDRSVRQPRRRHLDEQPAGDDIYDMGGDAPGAKVVNNRRLNDREPYSGAA